MPARLSIVHGHAGSRAGPVGHVGAAGTNMLAPPARVSRAVAGLQSDAARWPAGGRTWLLAAVSLVLAANVMSSRYLFPDSYYDLYAGRYILRYGLPYRNVFTAASRGVPWVDQQWLAHIVYYAAWAAGGYPALAALSAALITSGFALLSLLMLRRGVPPTRMVAWTLAGFAVCLGNVVIRAQSFAYPLIALTLWLILADSQAPRLRARTWLVIPVLVLWANTHGSVLLGAALVVVYAGYRVVMAPAQQRPASIPAFLALAAVAAGTALCTPYGIGVIGYYRSLIGNPVLAHNVLEWARPSPLYPVSWAFFGLVLAAAAAVVIAWRRGTRPDPLLAVLTVVLLALALTAIRNQAWFGFGGSLLAADTLARSSGGRVPVLGKAFRRATAGALAAVAVISLGVLIVTPDSQFECKIPQGALRAAAAIASRNPGVRILGDDWSGSPMLWLYPALHGRVGFDARFEQYSDSQLSAFSDFLEVSGARWQRVADGYGLVVASRLGRPRLAAALSKSRDWRVIYRDRTGVVLEKVART